MSATSVLRTRNDEEKQYSQNGRIPRNRALTECATMEEVLELSKNTLT